MAYPSRLNATNPRFPLSKMPKETRKLNDLSREEIQEAMMKKPSRQDRPCLWCGTVVLMKPDQSFCKPVCRSSYANHAKEIERRHFMDLEKRWNVERADLLLEIELLKAEIQKLKGAK